MIASITEVRISKDLIKECQDELRAEGKIYDKHISVGIMIEIPSAAVLISDFMEEVDFVSIGTNDLIQYLLAVDRGNEIVSGLYQEFNPAVVRTLYQIISEGRKSGKMISMCGAMASDIFAIPLLIWMGLQSLSASASAIPLIKRIVRSLSYKELNILALECLTMKTEKEINGRLHKFFNLKLHDQIKSLY